MRSTRGKGSGDERSPAEADEKLKMEVTIMTYSHHVCCKTVRIANLDSSFSYFVGSTLFRLDSTL